MSIPNQPPDDILHWHESETGIIGSTGVRKVRHRNGRKRIPNENPRLVWPYLGYLNGGAVTRVANPPLSSYVPTMRDNFPCYWEIASDTTFPELNVALNTSWAKMVSRVKGDSSALATTAAEGREALEMVGKRVLGLRRSYKALLKGDFRRFLKELSVDPKRKHRSWIRTGADEASGLWLEYWFGWSPTVNDIYNAALSLTVNPVLNTVSERGEAWFNVAERSTSIGNTSRRWLKTSSVKGFVKQGADFRLNNPNLFLANRLGVINPLAVAWELVPFSFVVDWFTNFGNTLESFTDLVGVDVIYPYTSIYASMTLEGRYGRASLGPDGNRCQTLGRCHVQRRKAGLTKPVAVSPLLSYFGTSLTRAATAVSLFNVVLLSKR